MPVTLDVQTHGHPATLDFSEEDGMPERRQEGLYQAIANVDAKHEAAHKRLRDDYKELEAQHEHLVDAFGLLKEKTLENTNSIGKVAETPPNVENVIMTPRVLITIVVFSISVFGGIWSSTYGLRSDVRDILTRMESQKSAYEANAKLQETQTTAMRTSIDEMKRRQELQQYEIQELSKAILTGRSR